MTAALTTQTLPIAGVPTRICRGGAQGGVPILLLHGAIPGVTPYCGGLHLWGAALALLARVAPVLAIDLPGAGGTGLGPAPFTLDRLATHAQAVLDHFGIDRAHLVGHDSGGLVAWHLAAARPERVAALTIAASPAAAPTGDSPHNVTLDSPPAPRYGHAAQRWALERLAYSPRAIDTQLLDDCLGAAQGAPHRDACERMIDPGARAAFGASAQQAKGRLYAQARDQGLVVATQVIWGSDDPLASIDHGLWLFRVIAAKQRATQFHVLNRTSHLLFRDDPETFCRVIDAFRTGLELQ